MAHQVIDDDLHPNFGSKSMLERPKLATLIGVIAGEWAYLEADLAFLYCILISGTIQPIPPDLLRGPHMLGLQIYEVLENTQKRIELLKSLAEHVLANNEPLLGHIKETLLPEIRRAAKRRNTILHAVWGVSDVYPDALLYIPASAKWMVYKESDFNEAIDLIINTSDSIRKCQADVRQFLERK